MSQLRHNRFDENRPDKASMAMVVLLCLCVMVQMLGVPMTLLNPEGAVDTHAVSTSEGFSVPSSIPQLTPSIEMIDMIDSQPSVHVPILAFALFHPPPVR